MLPADLRDDVTGDMNEMFARRCATSNVARARIWYCFQTLMFPLHFLAERLRERRRRVGATTLTSWIDFKLAVRMLGRYPGLTAVGVFGMAVGTAIATIAFAIGHTLLDPALPLPEGDRIVAIYLWDARKNDRETRLLHEFLIWRSPRGSVRDLGAFRTTGRNLIALGGAPETVSIAEISPSGFRVAGVAPLMGRYLLMNDERPGSPAVVVIGEDVWTRRFSRDPAILSHSIQLGSTTYAIVGVMPKTYRFPVNHQFWIPLRLPPTAQPLTGPELTVFARLSPGATLEQAQNEFASLGPNEYIRPRVVSYPLAFSDMDQPENALGLRAAQTLVVMLLVLVCINVAILIYARTATRQGEIAVRTALGASRRRIVGQLFIEAFALASVAAVVGVVLAAIALRQVTAGLIQLGAGLPFWMQFDLPPEGLVFVVGLTILAAVVVGVVPALKATGRHVQARLQGLSAGSGSRMQMGRLWTTLIVAQVAVAVAVLPATVHYAWSTLTFRSGDRGFASLEFLTADVWMEPHSDRVTNVAATQSELERALEAESQVAAVTFSLASPGAELAAVLQAEGVTAAIDAVDYNIASGSKHGHLVRFNRVAVDFFGAYDVPVLTGRGFRAGDAEAGAMPVLVNRALVDHIFGGVNPLGRRIRYVGMSREAGEGHVTLERWHEIVGVVPDFPPYAMRGDASDARLYHPAAAGDLNPVMLAVRVHGDAAASFTSRLREIAARVDPDIHTRRIATAEDALRREQGLMRLIGVALTAVTLSVIALAAAGIYALMSFTVARRRKEIGIRAALGADAPRILIGIFSRAFVQLGTGAALGMAAAIGLESVLEGEAFQGNTGVVLVTVVVLIITIGLLAAWGPARQGLHIQPTEALREE